MNWRWAALPLLLVSLAQADTVELTDGSRLKGTAKRESGGWAITDSSGKITHVKDAQVKSLAKTSALSPEKLAEAQLTALRRAVEPLENLPAIIDRYAQFIERYKSTPAAAAARKDLDLWKERLDQKMVKVGGTWLTPEEHSALLEKTAPLIEQVCTLIQQARYAEAESALKDLEARDPHNIAGAYLRGVMAYRQQQIGTAKRHFERVRELKGDYAPALNNLAVIAWEQRQVNLALTLFDLAMQARPHSRPILDNGAEVLHVLPPRERGSIHGRRVLKRFVEQDAVLRQQLAGQGMVRWGATFLSQAQMDEIKKAEANLLQRMDLVAEDRRRAEDRIREIDRQIFINEQTMREIDRDRSYFDEKGNLIQFPRPTIFYDLARENEDLVLEQDDLLDRIDSFEERVREIERQGPYPLYTGRPRIMEGEGVAANESQTPAAANDNTTPTTLPTTRPL